jgi:hypothetical protein
VSIGKQVHGGNLEGKGIEVKAKKEATIEVTEGRKTARTKNIDTNHIEMSSVLAGITHVCTRKSAYTDTERKMTRDHIVCGGIALLRDLHVDIEEKTAMNCDQDQDQDQVLET